MRPQRHLIVIGREPRLGAVKSRLARDIGAVAALHFYETMLLETVRRLAGGPWRCWLAVTPDRFARIAHRRCRALPRAFTPLPQGGGNLGRRMQRAFDLLPPGPAVLIGSDIPGVTPAHIEQAFAALGRHDTVFGPSPDGGFWLVGQRRLRCQADLFRNVRWSSAHALADCLANLPRAADGQAGAWGRAATLADIDDGADYRRWRQ